MDPGVYRLTFHTAEYFASLGGEGFYPEVTIAFEIEDPAQHYHVPLLLNPLRLLHLPRELSLATPMIRG